MPRGQRALDERAAGNLRRTGPLPIFEIADVIESAPGFERLRQERPGRGEQGCLRRVGRRTSGSPKKKELDVRLSFLFDLLQEEVYSMVNPCSAA